jgi:hypothetical protein
MHPAPALLVTLILALAACDDPSADARRAGQLRHDGRTLDEWWRLRRDPSDETVAEARAAIRVLGARAVPYLAAKAAGPELGDVIGGGLALEDQCPGALPAMQAARARHPSPALDEAIRRVRADSANRVRAGRCTARGEPAGGEPAGGATRP